jgi:hypothetical protein
MGVSVLLVLCCHFWGHVLTQFFTISRKGIFYTTSHLTKYTENILKANNILNKSRSTEGQVSHRFTLEVLN